MRITKHTGIALIAVRGLMAPVFAVDEMQAPLSLAKVEEPVPASAIKVSASSTFGAEQHCRHLVDRSGMTGDRHDNQAGASTMWQSVASPTNSCPAAGLPAAPAWVRFEFPQTTALTEVRIWNHNQASLTDRGFRNAVLSTSDDGVTWQSKDVSIPRASGQAGIPCSLVVKVSASCRLVILAAKSNFGSTCYGLSEVQFVRRRN